MSADDVNEIKVFLKAFNWDDVKTAFKQVQREYMDKRSDFMRTTEEYLSELEWEERPLDFEVPTGWEWRRVGHKLYVRDRSKPLDPKKDPHIVATGKVRAKARTDTSITQVHGLKCPECGGSLYKEPICPGCADGKKGFRIRLLCGDCDYTGLL